MKLYSIRQGSEEKLNNKEYVIGVGISLGNKWFSVENIVGLVQWSLLFSKEKVIVYVADSIHSINLEVRKKFPKERAEIVADAMGTEILEEVKKHLATELPKVDFDRIVFAKWKDLEDQEYKEKKSWLYKKYNEDILFHNAIIKLITEMTSLEIRKFSNEELEKLGTYFIEELPELIYQVKIKGYDCHAWVYPFTGKLVDFFDDIQSGKIFPEIRDKIMTTEPKVFLEVK